MFFDLDINQMNIKTAFLYKLIDYFMYINILKGFEIELNQSLVCKLLKALYNLKQSTCLWYERLLDFVLQKFELMRINANYNIFVTLANLDRPVLSMFVDDI